MIDKLRTAHAVKLEILQLYWERVEWEIKFLSGRLGDPAEIQAFLKELDRVKPETRDHVLKIFLEQCNWMHKIAFTQWRYLVLQLARDRKHMRFD